MSKRLILLAVLATAVAVLPASSWADTISYTTAGTFSSSGVANCSASGASILCNGQTVLSFTGTSVNMNINPGTTLNGSLGSFYVSAGAAADFNTGLTAFDLNINQTNPSFGSGLLSSTLSGNIYSDGTSNVWITFASPYSQTLGTVTYDISRDVNVSGQISIAQVGVANTLNSQVSESVPEPASLLLLGTGCLGMLCFRRRKRLTSISNA